VDEAPDRPDSEAEQLLEAVLAASSETRLPVVLRRLVELACGLTDARYGALGVIGPDGGLSDFIHVGIDETTMAAIGDPPKGNGILGLLIVEPRPLRLDDLGAHVESFGFPANHPPMHTFLGVPIRVRGDVFGNLYLTEKRSGTPFTAEDERRVMVLATAAGAVIENARRHSLARELAVMEDRERIARDLHDTVIQRLYAAGMGLQAVQRRVDDELVVQRIGDVVDALDATIREIRSVIFAVASAARGGGGLRSDILDVARDATTALGFEPSVSFDGPVDSEVPEGIADHALAVVREALSNAARHSRATDASVAVSVGGGMVRVLVADDGSGVSGPGRVGGRGISNLRSRAEALGGRLVLHPRDGGGTEVVWEVPLH
jgi:signal transduction histidine kinase